MKFVIERTSGLEPNVEGAFKECATIEEFRVGDMEWVRENPSMYTGWFDNGYNHHEKDGLLLRNRDIDAWFVEINTPEDIQKIAFEVDEEIIIRPYTEGEYSLMCLEVYDRFREHHSEVN